MHTSPTRPIGNNTQGFCNAGGKLLNFTIDWLTKMWQSKKSSLPGATFSNIYCRFQRKELFYSWMLFLQQWLKEKDLSAWISSHSWDYFWNWDTNPQSGLEQDETILCVKQFSQLVAERIVRRNGACCAVIVSAKDWETKIKSMIGVILKNIIREANEHLINKVVIVQTHCLDSLGTKMSIQFLVFDVPNLKVIFK